MTLQSRQRRINCAYIHHGRNWVQAPEVRPPAVVAQLGDTVARSAAASCDLREIIFTF